MPQIGNGNTVIGMDEVGLTALSDGASEDRFPGAVVIERVVFGGGALAPVGGERDQVKDGGGEVADLFAVLVGDVAGHRESLQIDLGAGHG